MTEEMTGMDELAAAARAVRLRTAGNLPRLVEQAVANLTAKGCQVHVADDTASALAFVDRVAAGRGKTVAGRVPAGAEIGLAAHVARLGGEWTTCHAGEWILAALGLAGGHPYRPTWGLAQLNEAEVWARLAAHPDLAPYRTESQDAAAVLNALAQRNTAACQDAGLGITGAAAVVAETGTVFLAEEEGDARLVSNLPSAHLVVAGVECLVPDLAGALTTIRYLSRYGFGRPLVRYVSAISGPSRTGDIGMELVPGMHGPREVAVLLLAGGRLDVSGPVTEALLCLHCGACVPPGAFLPAREPEPWPYPGVAGVLLRRLFGGGAAPVPAADRFTGCPLGIDMPGLWDALSRCRG